MRVAAAGKRYFSGADVVGLEGTIEDLISGLGLICCDWRWKERVVSEMLSIHR